MPVRDLRAWIDLLRREGELVEIEAEVDPQLEITEIVDRVLTAGGPALLFKRPKGSDHPLLINQFGTEQRMCLAFGEGSLDAVARRFQEFVGADEHERRGDASAVARTRRLAAASPKAVTAAPCQELILEPDLDLLPVQTCWPADPAPFITLPIVITRDPMTNRRNVGIYRMQKIDRRSTFMHWQIHKDAASHWRATEERLEVAVALGCDPVTTYAASAPFPASMDEFEVAGYLKGSPVELTMARTVNLEVPARAEIVLEGYVENGDVGMEGPFGDHTGYYSPPDLFPIFHLTGMTMRRDAIYPSIVVGPPPAEDAWLAKTSERLFLHLLRMSLPEVVDYDLPVAGAFQNCVIVSLRKGYVGHARKVMHAIWGLGQLALVKSVVVVDHSVNVHDYSEVFFRMCANVDPKRDLLLTEGPLDQLDHAAVAPSYGGKLGIDGTQKWPGEAQRPWPDAIEMSATVRALVDRRWDEYAIGGIGDSSPSPMAGRPERLF